MDTKSQGSLPMNEPTPTSSNTSAASPCNDELLRELRLLLEQLTELNGHNMFALNSLLPRALLMQFLKGTFFALGGLVGATIVLSVLIYFLSQMEVIPIIGSWVKQLNQIIQQP